MGMPKFRYIVRRGGVEIRGVVEAPSKADAIEELRRRGYERVRVRRMGRTTGQLFRRFFEKR